MLITSCLLLAAIAAAPLSQSHASAARPARNVLRPELPFRVIEGLHCPRVVILKFVEGRPIRLLGDALVALDLHEYEETGVDLTHCQSLLAPFTVERLFTRSVADLEQERAALLPRTPVTHPLPADLNQYYRITTDGVESTEHLVNELNTLALVETAYAQLSTDALVMLDNDVAPPTPLFESAQDFKGAAPDGHGYDPLRSLVGARAPDLTIGHLEASWHYGHEDACQMVTSNLVGDLPDETWDGWKDHGDAVAGILIADRNGYGVRGMSDAADFMLGSVQSGVADVISQCTALSEAGDVWVSSFAWSASGAQAPVDWPQAEFDAVFIAATKGIVYCFGAGNSGKRLSKESIFGTRYVAGAPDSGGVIVGASYSDSLDKSDFSNFAQRVDCHAWGENIGTIGYGDLFNASDTQRYTGVFGGTSAAGPVVAGIAAAVSNIVREQNGVQLTAFEIRDMLRTLGTPQGAGGHIGPRADLAQLLASHGLPDGLLVEGDGELGKEISISMRGEPGGSAVLYLSSGRGRTPVGLNRDFLLDLSTLVHLGSLSLSDRGELIHRARIPNYPLLAGMSFYLQMADTRPTGLHLSNSVELWIRN